MPAKKRAKKSAAKKTASRAAAKKTASKSKTPKSTGKKSKKIVRIDLIVEAQKKVIDGVGDFVEDAAEMVSKGEFSPVLWTKRYAEMWRDLAGGFANVLKRF